MKDVMPQSSVEKRSAVILTADKMSNATNFSQRQNFSGKTIEKQ
jgi:hypothetical protein